MAITACTCTFNGAASGVGNTLPNVPIGTAAADRLVLILLGTDATGCTIGGVTATPVGAPGSGIFAAIVPSGTTADVVYSGYTDVTLGGYSLVYAIYGGVAAGATFSGDSEPPLSFNANVSAGGAIIAFSIGSVNPPTYSSGVDLDNVFDAGGIYYAAGSREYASAQSVTVASNENSFLGIFTIEPAASAPTDPPSNTSAPSIPTNITAGQVVTPTPGGYSPAATSFVYRWFLDGSYHSTSATFNTTGHEGKKLSVGETGSNAAGSASEVMSNESNRITYAARTTNVTTTGAGSKTFDSTDLPNGSGVLSFVGVIGSGASGPRRGRGSGGGASKWSTNGGAFWVINVGDTIYWDIAGTVVGVSTTSGTNGASSWIRLGTNSAPTLASHGALAPGGTAGTSTTNGAGGLHSAGVGDGGYNGGNGGNTGSGTTLRGAGGGGAGFGGAGGNASAATQGAAGTDGGGLGGASGTGTSIAAAGAAGGGGGAISGASGNGGTSGRGQARYTFTPDLSSESGGGISGSGSATDVRDTASATGAAQIASTATATDTRDTATANGGVSTGGTGEATGSGDNATSSGYTGSSGVGNATDTGDSSNGTGGGCTGSGSGSDQADTATGSGALATSGIGNAIDTSDSVVAIAVASISGEGNATDNRDAASGYAETSWPPITGDASATDNRDTVTGSASVTANGAGNATELAGTCNATGSVGSAGSGSCTEGTDTAVASGTLATFGTGEATGGAGSATAMATATVSAIGAANDNRDTAQGVGTATEPAITGEGTATGNSDTASGSGSIQSSGSAEVYENADLATSVGATTNQGAGAASDNPDNAVAIARTYVLSGDNDIEEDYPDIADGVATVIVSSIGYATDQRDTAVGFGKIVEIGSNDEAPVLTIVCVFEDYREIGIEMAEAVNLDCEWKSDRELLVEWKG